MPGCSREDYCSLLCSGRLLWLPCCPNPFQGFIVQSVDTSETPIWWCTARKEKMPDFKVLSVTFVLSFPDGQNGVRALWAAVIQIQRRSANGLLQIIITRSNVRYLAASALTIAAKSANISNSRVSGVYRVWSILRSRLSKSCTHSSSCTHKLRTNQCSN
jgi:hypothetical protein